jgi:hypothetical protein
VRADLLEAFEVLICTFCRACPIPVPLRIGNGYFSFSQQ